MVYQDRPGKTPSRLFFCMTGHLCGELDRDCVTDSRLYELIRSNKLILS